MAEKNPISEISGEGSYNLWEKLSTVIQDFPVLYDKSHKEFHRKNVKANAWTEIGNIRETNEENAPVL